MSLIAQSEERPMRLTYPFVQLSNPNEEQTTNVYVCDLAVDEVVYLGVKGGSECASFSVTPYFYDGDCSEETNAEHTIKAQEDTTVPLIPGAWQFGHCARGGWSTVSYSHTFIKGVALDNVLMEIEVLGNDSVAVGSLLDPTAMSVYLFDGAMPPDTAEREYNYLIRSWASQNGVYTISQVRRKFESVKRINLRPNSSLNFELNFLPCLSNFSCTPPSSVVRGSQQATRHSRRRDNNQIYKCGYEVF